METNVGELEQADYKQDDNEQRIKSLTTGRTVKAVDNINGGKMPAGSGIL